MITESTRKEFVAAHVTPAVKVALRKQSLLTGQSMSKLIAQAVADYLESHGHNVTGDGEACAV